MSEAEQELNTGREHRPAELDDYDIPPYATTPDTPTGWAAVEELRHVYDPEIPVNIYELGLIYQIDINAAEDEVFVLMTLTSPGCPVAGEMPGWVEDAIRKALPDLKQFDLDLVFDPPWNPTMMSETAKLQLNIPFEAMDIPGHRGEM